MPEPRICVVGAANIDLIANVRRLPVLGETVYADSFQTDCGGKGSNQAMMARTLGGRVTMVAKLGRDIFGERVFTNYGQHGIDTSCVSWDEERSSGVASILVDAEGRNAIVYSPGANFGLTPADIRAARSAIETADVVVCQLEVPLDATAEALRTAKSGGRAVTILNPAPAAVVTLGARGTLLVDRDGTAHVAGVPVTAADSAGAGDAFIGTLAYFLGRGEPLLRAARRANVAAALSVTKAGTRSSFPTRADVDELARRLGVDV
ncbi:MAG TPA: ribokinase [bacterium]|nr:ribokinase [bacterium]